MEWFYAESCVSAPRLSLSGASKPNDLPKRSSPNLNSAQEMSRMSITASSICVVTTRIGKLHEIGWVIDDAFQNEYRSTDTNNSTAVTKRAVGTRFGNSCCAVCCVLLRWLCAPVHTCERKSHHTLK